MEWGVGMTNNKKQMIINKKVQSLNQNLQSVKLEYDLAKNNALMRNLFDKTDTIVYREFENKKGYAIKGFIVYSDGLVDSVIMNENIIKPLLLTTFSEDCGDFMTYLMNQVLTVNELERTTDICKIIDSVTYGDTILFLDGYNDALILNTKSFATRSIDEPDAEKIIQGPKEGFVETLLQNLSLIRRRVRTNSLKMEFITFGTITQTKACICYIDGLVEPSVLKDLKKKIGSVQIDGVLDANYMAELIKSSRITPFTTVGQTQRPDAVIGKLLEGRIALFIDGTPVVLTLPYLFVENFQSSEDYYMNFYYASFSRLLRYFGFFITVVMPALYILVVGYHFEILPPSLLTNFTIEQQSVPLPASLELLIFLAVYDILRETGARMPPNIGQALSIVGALVIGDAAVSAKLVSAQTIIVVAVAGLANLLVPKISGPVIIIRYGLLLLVSFFGLLGITAGFAIILAHILSLDSYGVPYVLSNNKLTVQSQKDLLIRSPWWIMKTRDKQLTSNITRLKDKRSSGQ